MPAGAYIVRSGQRETEFYLSVRAPEGGPKVRHIEVDRYEDDFVAVLGDSDDALGFATFGKLLEYLRSTPTTFEGCENDLILTEFVDRLGITTLWAGSQFHGYVLKWNLNATLSCPCKPLFKRVFKTQRTEFGIVYVLTSDADLKFDKNRSGKNCVVLAIYSLKNT